MNLVYTSTDSKYWRFVRFLLLSINYHTVTQPSFEFLVIHPNASEVYELPKHLRFKVGFHSVPKGTVKPGVKALDAAVSADAMENSMNKVLINLIPNISAYDHILFLDADTLVNFDLNELFVRQDLKPGVLYAKAEGQPHNNFEFGYRNYTPAQLQEFHAASIQTFNAGVFVFKNSLEMLSHFRDLHSMMFHHQGQHFYEQSYMNYYFNTRKLVNYQALADLVVHKFVDNTLIKDPYARKAIFHLLVFPTEKKEQAYATLRSRLLSRHSSHGSALDLALRVISYVSAQALPPEKRGSWSKIGHIAEHPAQVTTMQRLAANPRVKSICEIGFRAGHSSAVFLTANKHAVLHTFDLMGYPYSAPQAQMMKALFPGRFHLVSGSSAVTLPAVIRRNDVTCDLFSVNGNHSHDAALTDFINAAQLTPVGGILLADGISVRTPGCQQAWQEMVASGYLESPVCEQAADGMKGWCYAYVKSKTGNLTAPLRGGLLR